MAVVGPNVPYNQLSIERDMFSKLHIWPHPLIPLLEEREAGLFVL
jgi:hypothetical protein